MSKISSISHIKSSQD